MSSLNLSPPKGIPATENFLSKVKNELFKIKSSGILILHLCGCY